MSLLDRLAAEEEMQAIIDRADREGGRDLTQEEVNRFDSLRIKTDHATAVTPAVVGRVPRAEESPQDAAFAAYLRTGQPNSNLGHLQNAQGEGIPASGGYLVPPEFLKRVVERLKAYGGVAAAAETIITDTGATLLWPTLDDDTGTLGEIVLEHGTWSAGADFSFDTASLGAHRYATGGAGSTPIRISVELLQDSGIDVVELVARKLAERIGRVQAVHLVTGSGAGMPKGLITNKTGVQLAANTAVKYDDLINFVHAVDPAYREEGCVWMFNDQSLATIRKIKDAAGDPLWRPSLEDPGRMSLSGSLLGYPVLVDQGFPNISLASGTVNWGVFGNIRRGYIIRRVRDVVIAVNPYSRMNNGEVEYSAWARMDATVQDANAYVALTGKAA